MAEERVRVSPEVCSYVDDEHATLSIEVSIPGVSKEDIVLRIHEDSMNLKAPRGDIEYVTTLSFCCPVDHNKAKATYKNGQLIIDVPFKDVMKDAVQVKIE
jgi:HSP20 family protein